MSQDKLLFQCMFGHLPGIRAWGKPRDPWRTTVYQDLTSLCSQYKWFGIAQDRTGWRQLTVTMVPITCQPDGTGLGSHIPNTCAGTCHLAVVTLTIAAGIWPLWTLCGRFEGLRLSPDHGLLICHFASSVCSSFACFDMPSQLTNAAVIGTQPLWMPRGI